MTDVRSNLLNFDDVVPTRLLSQIKDARSFPRAAGRYRHRSGNSEAGIEPEKLLDWRRLEQRTFEIHQKSDAAHDVFYKQHLGQFHNIVKKNKEVWVINQNRPDDVMVVYSNNDRSGVEWVFRSMDSIILEGKRNPRYRGVIVKGQQAEEIIHAVRMAGTWRKRYWTYNAAFQDAVEIRIWSYADANLKNVLKYQRFEDCIFSIENQGRRYVVQFDGLNHKIWWSSANIISFV